VVQFLLRWYPLPPSLSFRFLLSVLYVAPRWSSILKPLKIRGEHVFAILGQCRVPLRHVFACNAPSGEGHPEGARFEPGSISLGEGNWIPRLSRLPSLIQIPVLKYRKEAIGQSDSARFEVFATVPLLMFAFLIGDLQAKVLSIVMAS
jgi:hypothetical protein